MATLTEGAVRDALFQFDALWDQLFPTEQARIVKLLIKRVSVSTDGAALEFRTEGLGSILRELGHVGPTLAAEAAA